MKWRNKSEGAIKTDGWMMSYADMATILLADFDAETRFELRAARGRGRTAEGLSLLDKAAGKQARSKRN